MTDDEFLLKIRQAINLNLEYFERVKEKPNLSRDKFLATLRMATPEYMSVRWSRRQTSKGKHSRSGEDSVFHFEFEVYMILNRRKIPYYCKGYFFDKDQLKGVFIHSFREK